MEYSNCKKLKSKIVREELEKELGIKIKDIFIASSNSEEMKFYVEKAKENHFTFSESPSFSKSDDFSIYATVGSDDSIIRLPEDDGYLARI